MKELLLKVLFNLLLQIVGVDALDMCPELDDSLIGVINWIKIELHLALDTVEEVWDDLLLL